MNGIFLVNGVTAPVVLRAHTPSTVSSLFGARISTSYGPDVANLHPADPCLSQDCC